MIINLKVHYYIQGSKLQWNQSHISCWNIQVDATYNTSDSFLRFTFTTKPGAFRNLNNPITGYKDQEGSVMNVIKRLFDIVNAIYLDEQLHYIHDHHNKPKDSRPNRVRLNKHNIPQPSLLPFRGGLKPNTNHRTSDSVLQRWNLSVKNSTNLTFREKSEVIFKLENGRAIIIHVLSLTRILNIWQVAADKEISRYAVFLSSWNFHATRICVE